MAILLPVMLMLLFTFVFGGAIDPSGSYVDYVVPGIILLCAGFGAASTAVYVAGDMKAGIIDRFRTMPLRASAVLTGPRRREPAAQPARDGRRHRSRAARRLPPDGGCLGMDRGDRDHRALHPHHHLSVRGDRPRGGQPRSGERLRVHHPVRPVSLERVRPRRHHARRGCSGSQRTSRSRRSSRRSAACCSDCRSARSRGGRWAGASAILAFAVVWGAWLFRRKAGAITPRRGAPAGVSGRAASSARWRRRAWRMRQPGRRRRRRGRRIRERRSSGEFGLGVRRRRGMGSSQSSTSSRGAEDRL